jgi:hypothetical protein
VISFREEMDRPVSVLWKRASRTLSEKKCSRTSLVAGTKGVALPAYHAYKAIQKP